MAIMLVIILSWSLNKGLNLHFHSFCIIQGDIKANEVADLLSTEKRATVSVKWPMGVAAFEFILETLDSWETSIPSELLVRHVKDKTIVYRMKLFMDISYLLMEFRRRFKKAPIKRCWTCHLAKDFLRCGPHYVKC